ncbi:hypothetical protein SprV_0401414900 [Sparganum proliferum]
MPRSRHVIGAMAAGDVAVEAFQRLLHGQQFPSFRDLEEAIARFSEETGYHFKPVNSHKFTAGSPEAETFVFSSRKYVCVLASARKRVGCDAFFNIGHRKAGYLAVTSFKAEHGHEPVPVEPRHSKQKSPGSRLTDFRTLRAASPTNSKIVDNERLDADEYCRRRHYNGLRPHIARVCQMLTGYAAEVLLNHISANASVRLCSDAVDTCSCRFHRNWQLPCVHIMNYVEQHGVNPCLALSKSRWVFRLDVCERPVTDENVDPVAVTSFQADILVSKGRGPLTEDYKYRVAMRHVQPIVEKLKSCGSRRFEELLREVDAFANRIMNAPSGCQHGSFVDLPPQPSGDEVEDDTSDEVVRCQMREEGDVLIAQWGSNQDPSVRVLRNDSLLPNFHIRGRPCMRRSWATHKPLRSRPTNTTVSTDSASTSRMRMDSGIPSWHLDERAVDIDDIPFVDACGVCGGNTMHGNALPRPRRAHIHARCQDSPAQFF